MFRKTLTGTIVFILAVHCAQTIPVHARSVEAPNPEAVRRVLAGEISEANAAWWGFDPADSTQAIQSAIDSGASRVVIPNMGQDWIVEPIFLQSNQEIVFDPGTVVTAKRGSFRGVMDSLFSARAKENIVLRGEGATLRMHKEDYQSDDYEPAEWRHTLAIFGCNNVKIEGLTLRDSGGDGIYVGSGTWRRPGYPRFPGNQPYSRDIVIRNVVADGHHRQGLSVISVENLLVEESVFRNTSGTAPEAGIDIEPNGPNDRLTNIVIRNVVSENNRGAAFFVHVAKLNGDSGPVDIRFENCVARGGRIEAFSVHGPGGDRPVPGLIELVNFQVENTGGGVLNIREKPADSFTVRFVGGRFENVSNNDTRYTRHPFWIQIREKDLLDQGGIEFVDSLFIDDRDRPFLVAANQGNVKVKLRNVSGTLRVRNPHGAQTRLPPEVPGFDLNVIEE